VRSRCARSRPSSRTWPAGAVSLDPDPIGGPPRAARPCRRRRRRRRSGASAPSFSRASWSIQRPSSLPATTAMRPHAPAPTARTSRSPALRSPGGHALVEAVRGGGLRREDLGRAARVGIAPPAGRRLRAVLVDLRHDAAERLDGLPGRRAGPRRRRRPRGKLAAPASSRPEPERLERRAPRGRAPSDCALDHHLTRR
jgi:hypothetical protein